MRIGVNCLPLQPKVGGVRQYFFRLFRELLENDNENQYVFFYGENNLSELKQIGSERWLANAVMVSDYGDILRQLGTIDVYFCPFQMLWPRPLPVASVVKLGDIQEVFYPQFFTEEILTWRKRHYPGSTRGADAVVTVSDYSKRTFEEYHLIPPEKIFVAYHTADEFFQTPDASCTARFNLPERFVFYPANHWQHKNHDALLRALSLLKTERSMMVPAVLTGFDVDNGYPLQEKIEEYGLAELAQVVGYVNEDEVQGLFGRATMLCFPSLFEGFGMPVLEAMASGCPVVCSNATSIPEVAGDVALYFDPDDPRQIADRISKLWNDPELCLNLSVRGRERARQFTARRLAQVHLQAFQYAYDTFGSDARELYRHYLYEPLAKLEEAVQSQRTVNLSVHMLQKSLSWRITAPLRWVGRFVRGK